MSILSAPFAGFLIISLICYYLMPAKYRWIVLLTGSYVFYAAGNWKWLAFILFTTVQTYLTGLYLEKMNGRISREVKSIEDREERKKRREQLTRYKKWAVALAVVVNFGILAVFKLSYVWRETSLLLPLGISFYTFQSIGYIIDVYRNQAAAEHNLFKYALFVGYFPSLLQGPINRFKNLVPQFYEGKPFRWITLKRGFGLFLWGVFKKLVIANRAAVFVNHIFYGELENVPGSMVLIGAFLFNLELYGDFSGGIDMVQGISEMFGIELAENFRRPFFAQSIAEYWRRWHISLGKWLKDYVFFPIAGSKAFGDLSIFLKKKCGKHIGKTVPGAIASIITFIIVGLWHEVTVFYVLYGLWHGGIMAISSVAEPLLKKINQVLGVRTESMSHRWFRRGRTFLLIALGECLTMATTLSGMLLIYKRMLFHFDYPALILGWNQYGLQTSDWLCLIAGVIVMICVSMKQESGVRIREALGRQSLWFQWLVTIGIILVILVCGIYGPGYNAASFIYGGF